MKTSKLMAIIGLAALVTFGFASSDRRQDRRELLRNIANNSNRQEERRQERRQENRSDHRGAKEALALLALRHHQNAAEEAPSYRIEGPYQVSKDSHRNGVEGEVDYATDVYSLKSNPIFYGPDQILYDEIATAPFDWKNPDENDPSSVHVLGGGLSTSTLTLEDPNSKASYPHSIFHRLFYAAVPAGVSSRLVKDGEQDFLFLTRTVFDGDGPGNDNDAFLRSVLFAYEFVNGAIIPADLTNVLTGGLNEAMVVDRRQYTLQTLTYEPVPEKQKVYYIASTAVDDNEDDREAWLCVLSYSKDQTREGRWKITEERNERIVILGRYKRTPETSDEVREWSLAVSPSGSTIAAAFGGSQGGTIRLFSTEDPSKEQEFPISASMNNGLKEDLVYLSENLLVAIEQVSGISSAHLFEVNPGHVPASKDLLSQSLYVRGSPLTYAVSASRMEHTLLLSTVNLSYPKENHIITRDSDLVIHNDIVSFFVSNDNEVNEGSIVIPGTPIKPLSRGNLQERLASLDRRLFEAWLNGGRDAAQEELAKMFQEHLSEVLAEMNIRYDVAYQEKNYNIVYAEYPLAGLASAYPKVKKLKTLEQWLTFLQQNAASAGTSHIFAARLKSE